jgi:hypothetical protein
MKLLSFLSVFFIALPAAASQEISQRIQEEFSRIYAVAEAAEAEYTVGGFMEGKSYGDHELLWRLGSENGGYDIIRIYRDKGDRQQSLGISYYRARHIVPGRTVIRRFVGPDISGWRNDTIDADTGEYLGSQGARQPSLDRRDRQILKKWGVRLFE